MVDESLIFNLQIICRRVQSLKELDRFERHFRLPSKVDSAGRQFLFQLSEFEIAADLDAKHTLFRNLFGLKRRQLTAQGPDRGQGSLSTPLFDYLIEVDYWDKDLSRIQWQRTFASIKNLQLFQQPGCQQIFQDEVVEICVDLGQPIDLENIIDSIEEMGANELTLDYDKEATWCEIGIVERDERLHFTKDKISMIGDNGNFRLAGLIQSWLLIQQQLKTILATAGNRNLPGNDLAP